MINANEPIELSREEFRAELLAMDEDNERRAGEHATACYMAARHAHYQHRGRLAPGQAALPWDQHMSVLAASFHAIAELPGVRPWNADVFDKAARAGLSPASKACAQFVLSVWNPDHKWRCGRFDAVASIARWDLLHRRAFAAWARFPWWP